MTGAAPIHATAVARFGATGWVCALLSGPSGAGKSDLALRLVAHGWRLVSDDYTHVWASGGTLHATAPTTIVGQIEARGLGVVPAPTRHVARVGLIVDCVQTTVERMPNDALETIAGVSVPRLSLDIRPASAIETVTQAMARL